jgi:hypothetical protein
MHFIQYKEASLPIQIDFAVINRACSKLNITLKDFEQTVNVPSHTKIVFFEALRRGHQLDGKVFNSTEDEAEEILSYEHNYGEFIKIFSDCVVNMFTSNQVDSKKN